MEATYPYAIKNKRKARNKNTDIDRAQLWMCGYKLYLSGCRIKRQYSEEVLHFILLSISPELVNNVRMKMNLSES